MTKLPRIHATLMVFSDQSAIVVHEPSGISVPLMKGRRGWQKSKLALREKVAEAAKSKVRIAAMDIDQKALEAAAEAIDEIWSALMLDVGISPETALKMARAAIVAYEVAKPDAVADAVEKNSDD